MINRVPAPSGDDEIKRQQLSAAAKKAEAQRVQKTEAVDDESKSRQRFKAMMDEDQDEEPTTDSQQPSPFETSFYKATAKQTPQIDVGQSVPNPSYSPPPNLNELSPASDDYFGDGSFTANLDPYSGDGLPQSLDAYQFTPEDPFAEPKFIEDHPKKKAPPVQHGKTGMDKGPAGGARVGKKVEPSPFTPQAKPVNKSSKLVPKESKSVPLERSSETKTSKVEKPKGKRALPKPFELEKHVAERPSKAKEMEHHKKEEKSQKIEVISPSMTTLPASIEPMAQTAAAGAAPYISPEMQAIFYQMVGTIFIMSGPKGVSTTEFVLNNPNFANSKFYGATISLTRFSTAPHAFNINLTGSTEAVTAFNQSIEGLKTAFKNGNFKFQIGRIDASYAKPVFHRKGKHEGSEREGKNR